MGHRGRKGAQLGECRRNPGGFLRKKRSESIPGPRIADHRVGSKLAAVLHAYSHGALSAVKQDFTNLGAEYYLPAGRFDDRRDAGGEAGCSAHRKTDAFEIVRSDNGMHGEAALRRWQAVIAPLRRENPFRVERTLFIAVPTRRFHLRLMIFLPSGEGRRDTGPPAARLSILTRIMACLRQNKTLCAQGMLDRGGAEWQDEKLRQARSCTPYAPGCENATSSPCAEVAELADALHSGCSSRQGVEVRVLSSAPYVKKSPI